MSFIRASVCVVVLGLLVLSGGCASYVNIPSQTGDVADHNPNLKTVGKIEAIALQGVIEDHPATGDIRVVLPEGTNPEMYNKVVAQVPKGVWSSNAPATDNYTLEVRQVRTRGTYAQVDVIRPVNTAAPAEHRQLVTVNLRYDVIAGWYVTKLKIWNIRLEDALIQSVHQAELDIQQ